MADNQADNQATPSSIPESVANNNAIGERTIGTEPIAKKQPWRDVIQQQQPVQLDFLKPTPAISSGNNGKIRLLAELDSKSR